jgi:hypothetical protein
VTGAHKGWLVDLYQGNPARWSHQGYSKIFSVSMAFFPVTTNPESMTHRSEFEVHRSIAW